MKKQADHASKKFKFVLDKPAPKAEEVEQLLNFQAVLRRHRPAKKGFTFEKTLVFLNKLMPLLVLALIIGALMLIFSKINEKKTVPMDQKQQEMPESKFLEE